MTPIPSSYLARTIYHQRWVEPDEAPAPDGAPPGGGRRAVWSVAVAHARRAALWIRAGTGTLVAGQPRRLREAGQ